MTLHVESAEAEARHKSAAGGGRTEPGCSMRIAHVVLELNVGGLERVVVDLARAQAAAGHTVHVFCLTERQALAAELRQGGVEVTVFNKASGFSAATLWSLARRMRNIAVDIVHSHNSVIHHYAVLAAKLAGAQVVNTQHGVSALARARRQRLIFRSTLPLTAAVVFVSEETRRAIVEELGIRAGRAAVIPNGIRTEHFTAAPAAPGERHPRVRFGTVGRMVAVKDHATLLRAFARLAGRLPAAELHLLGCGELREATEQLTVELGLRNRVHFYPGGGDTRAFYSGLDVFVLSSETEGMPITVLEAMSAGLPVVSTRVGGVPEAAPEHEVAWYCPPKDPAALADAMYAAATSPELRRRGARARQLVLERYALSVMAQRYMDLYAAVTGRGPGVRA